MSDLIPHREPLLVTSDGEWTTWSYRGATVRSSGVHNRLALQGHPFDGKNFGQQDMCLRLVDHWLDHQALPPPYVWPVPPPALR